MQCKDIMKTDVVRVHPTDTVALAATKMRERNVGFLPVCDSDGRVRGAITDRDITLRVVSLNKDSKTPVAEAMTPDAIVCAPGDDIRIAEELMAKNHKARMMCTDVTGKLVGIISLSDIAKHEPSSRRTGKLLSEVADREVSP